MTTMTRPEAARKKNGDTLFTVMVLVGFFVLAVSVLNMFPGLFLTLSLLGVVFVVLLVLRARSRPRIRFRRPRH